MTQSFVALAMPPSSPKEAGSRITIVVLTYIRAQRLMETLHRLRALPESPQIVVADNASTDETVWLAGFAFPEVRIVQCGSNLGAAGRNRAVAYVATEYVAFCDDDTWWAPGSLARAVRVLDASPQVGVLNVRGSKSATRATRTRPAQ